MNWTWISESVSKVIRKLIYPVRKEPVFFMLSSLCLSSPSIISVIKNFGDITMTKGVIMGVCGGLFWSYLGAVIIRLACFGLLRSVVKTLLYGLVIFLAFATAALRLGFGMYISPMVLSVVFDTNEREAGEFLYTFMRTDTIVMLAVTAALLVVVAIMAECRCPRRCEVSRSERPQAMKVAEALLVICLLCGAYSTSDIFHMLTYDGIEEVEKRWDRHDDHIRDLYGDPVSRLMSSGVSVYLSRGSVKMWTPVNEAAYVAGNVTHADSDLKVVVVIGESYIKSHSGLYGYTKDTTPHMNRERANGNLVAFNDVVTSYNATIDVMRNVLSTNDSSRDEDWWSRPYFPLLFASAGWKVYYWDNQVKRRYDTLIYNFTTPDMLFNDYLMEHCYTGLYDKTYDYDGELIDDFNRSVSIGDGNELTVLHLMGQHVSFYQRYPHISECQIFKSGGNS